MSCLFRSLSYFIKENTQVIRQKICIYLEKNNTIIDGIDTKKILKMEGTSNYTKNMRKSSTWGGAIEIQAACNIWNLKCIVRNIRNRRGRDIEFLPVNGGKIKKTIVITWNGNHYEPVRNL